MTKIRINLDVLIEAENPKEAYHKLCSEMEKTSLNWLSGNDWCTDEGLIAKDEVSKAICDVVNERDLRVKILHDDCADNPREMWDNAGIMYCEHRRYSLGDRSAEHPDSLINIVCRLPLYLLDHSGLAMSTGSFNDIWDSGQVGVIYLTKQRAEEWGIPPERYEEHLKAEVTTYDHYLRGNVWGYELGTGESCYGFYGSDLEETGMLEEVPEEYHENMKKAWEERWK